MLEQVAPLQAEMATLLHKSSGAREQLARYESDLHELDAKVQALKTEFEQKKGEEVALQQGLQRAKTTLTAAEALVGQLSSEKARWQAQVAGIAGQLSGLLPHAVLAAAFATYLGPAPEAQRRAQVEQWRALLSVPADAGSIVSLLSSEVEVGAWKAAGGWGRMGRMQHQRIQTGLPGDDVTIENVVIITKAAATRHVVLIDPVETASSWLLRHLVQQHAAETVPPVEAVAAGDPRFSNTLELAVRFGKWLVVQDVDGVEPLMVPLLRGELVQNGGGWMVAVGEKMVDYNANFRLFLVSRDSTLSLQPNIAPLLVVANFAITRY